MKHYNVRGRLIDNTVAVIAADGLDKTTTKSIVKGIDLPESYIYQYFSGKDDLLAQTFAALDCELVDTTMRHIAVMHLDDWAYETRCRYFFEMVWRFLLRHREKCLAFVRYYYSPYFLKYSADAHRARFQPVVEHFERAFRAEANVWMLLNHILNVMLDFAVKVFSDAVPDNDDTAEHVFRLIYFSVSPYFKREQGEQNAV